MKIVLAASAAFVALASPALAQTSSTTTTTTRTTTTEIPATVRTYVTEQSVPSVALDGDIVVGRALPETVTITTIPDTPDYGYAIVNDRRVVIDPRTRSVIEVYD